MPAASRFFPIAATQYHDGRSKRKPARSTLVVSCHPMLFAL
jgi:hypothetical protein